MFIIEKCLNFDSISLLTNESNYRTLSNPIFVFMICLQFKRQLSKHILKCVCVCVIVTMFTGNQSNEWMYFSAHVCLCAQG